MAQTEPIHSSVVLREHAGKNVMIMHSYFIITETLLNLSM